MMLIMNVCPFLIRPFFFRDKARINLYTIYFKMEKEFFLRMYEVIMRNYAANENDGLN